MNFTSYSQIEQAYNQLQFDLALSENTSLFTEMHNYISENIIELPYSEDVFTEAKDGKNFLERIWDFIVGVWNAIKKFFGMLFRAVKQLFTGKSETEKLIEKLENNSEDIADSIQNKPAAEIVKVLTELFVPKKNNKEVKKESASYLSESNKPEIKNIFDKLATLTENKDMTWDDLWKDNKYRNLILEVFQSIIGKKNDNLNEVSFLKHLLLFKLRQNDILLNIIDMIYNEEYYFVGNTNQLYNHFDYDKFEEETYEAAEKAISGEISDNEYELLISKLKPKKEQLIPRNSFNYLTPHGPVHAFLEPYMDSLLSSINEKYNIVSKDTIRKVVEETNLYKAILAKAMLVFSYTKLIILLLSKRGTIICSFEPRNNVTPSIYDFNYYYHIDREKNEYGHNIVHPTNVYNEGPSGAKKLFIFKKERYNSLLKSLKDAHDNIIGDISKPLPELDIQFIKSMFESMIIPLNILNPNIPLQQIEQNTERFSIYRKCKTDIDYYKIMGKGVPKVQVENFIKHFNFMDRYGETQHYNNFSFKKGQPGPKNNETKEDAYFLPPYLTKANGSMRFLLSNTFMYWTKIHNNSLKTLTLYKNKLNYHTINKSILNSIAKIYNIKL